MIDTQKVKKLKDKIIQEMESKYDELVKLSADEILEQCHIYSKMQDILELILEPQKYMLFDDDGLTEKTIDALLNTDDVLMKIIETYFSDYEDMRAYIPAINAAFTEATSKNINISGSAPSWVSKIEPIAGNAVLYKTSNDEGTVLYETYEVDKDDTN